MIGDRDTEIKGEEGPDEGQYLCTCVANLRRAHSRVEIHSKVLTYP